MNFMTTPNWRSRLGSLFPAAPQPLPEEQPPAPPPETVLIVDDDESWASECAFTLRTLGYDAVIARDPDAAIGLYLAHDIPVAIVDYNIPGRDGIALINELTQIAEAQSRKLHFIMATGYATKDVAIDAMRAAAVDFLEKPIRQPDLRKALQRIRGLRDTPDAREVLLGTMSSLSSELQRLARLIDEPGSPAAPAPGLPATLAPPSAAPPDPFLHGRRRGDRPADDRIAYDSPPAVPAVAHNVPLPALATFIREMLKKEVKRRSIGGGEVFGDPAWEMLLDLMLAKIEGYKVSVSSACIASGTPMSTALRLVGRLVDEGVLRKQPDETDRRRHFLAINPDFERPLLAYLVEQFGKATPLDES